MRKIKEFIYKEKYSFLFLGTVLYFIIMFSFAVPYVKKEKQDYTKKEIAKWDSVFHKRCDCCK